jgi:hypothetical protein
MNVGKFIDFKLLKIPSPPWSEWLYLLKHYITNVIIILTVTSASIALLFNSNVPWTGISFSCTKSPWKEISTGMCAAEKWVYRINSFVASLYKWCTWDQVDRLRNWDYKRDFVLRTEPAQWCHRFFRQHTSSVCRKDARLLRNNSRKPKNMHVKKFYTGPSVWTNCLACNYLAVKCRLDGDDF